MAAVFYGPTRWSGYIPPPKVNSSPLKSYRNPIGKACLPTTFFQRRAVKLRVSNQVSMLERRKTPLQFKKGTKKGIFGSDDFPFQSSVKISASKICSIFQEEIREFWGSETDSDGRGAVLLNHQAAFSPCRKLLHFSAVMPRYGRSTTQQKGGQNTYKCRIV